MTVIFDFDDTLFDKSSFVDRLAEIMGVSGDEFLDTYNEHFKKNKISYSAYEHLEVLNGIKREQFDKRSAQKRVDEFLQDVSAFVFPDAVKLLEAVRKKEPELILLSAGNSDFQRVKIKNSGISDFFDKIIVTADKVDSLRPWSGKEIIFINDKEGENCKVAKEYPLAKVLLINNSRHSCKAYKLKDIIYLWQ
ncbi:MAG: HAD family hydrolase [Patescibacteria group bacterium]